MKRDVVIVGTHYTLLLYFLLNKNFRENYYITNENVIYELLKGENFKVERLKVEDTDAIYRLFNKLENKEIRNNLNFIGSDHIESYYILRIFIDSFTLLEDGLKNYRFDIEKELKRKYPQAGLDDKVKKIILTGLDEVPEIIKHKVEIVNMKQKWLEKSLEEKKEILNIFNITLEDINDMKESEVVFFTQPLTEDDFTELEEEMALYDKLLEKYRNNKVIIKTHPREVKNYKELLLKYPNIKLFNKKVPIELFSLLGVEFDIVSTVFSTSVLQVKCKQINFYGTKNINQKIYDYFGDIKLF